MVVIELFLFHFEHVKGERKLNFKTNNINMFLNKTKIGINASFFDLFFFDRAL